MISVDARSPNPILLWTESVTARGFKSDPMCVPAKQRAHIGSAYTGLMDTADSRAYDSYLGGMNPGPRYSGQPNVKPPEGSQGTPPPTGTRVRHRLSGETGQVTGVHVHGHSGERMPTVRWDGQPATGFTSDQGYSMDSLTNP